VAQIGLHKPCIKHGAFCIVVLLAGTAISGSFAVVVVVSRIDLQACGSLPVIFTTRERALVGNRTP
jgi:hypothetical protein